MVIVSCGSRQTRRFGVFVVVRPTIRMRDDRRGVDGERQRRVRRAREQWTYANGMMSGACPPPAHSVWYCESRP